MNINRWALNIDMDRKENFEEAMLLIPRVLNVLHNLEMVLSLQDLYLGLECGDIPLYLALHALCEKGIINGYSPYYSEMDGMNHNQMFYSVS